MTLPMGQVARWWRVLGDGRVACELCPRGCVVAEGHRGACQVRRVKDGRLTTLNGYSSGFAVDPVEKKPLYHFFPGSRVFSFGTVGCNLSCRFCQNWRISQIPEVERLVEASPKQIADGARVSGCLGVAFTYNDPVVFAEYALETAEACRGVGLKTVAVTAGFVLPPARNELFAAMDAANIDLKAFTDDFYRSVCGGKLAPVLDTLVYVKHESDCWLEVTTLLVPGKNDSEEELTAMVRWAYRELGPDVPWHFSAFHPDHRMRELPPTSAATVARARKIAANEGLRFVYTGNVYDPEGSRTVCAGCGKLLIERDGFRVVSNLVTAGQCPACGEAVPGRFD